MSTFDLPIQCHSRDLFLEKFDKEHKNRLALANCYGNYRSLGVVYTSEIMKIIEDFDELHNIKKTPFIADNLSKEEKTECKFKKPTNFIHKDLKLHKFEGIGYGKQSSTSTRNSCDKLEFYNPKNLKYFQSRVSFKFVTFVKSNDYKMSIEDNVTEEAVESKWPPKTPMEVKKPVQSSMKFLTPASGSVLSKSNSPPKKSTKDTNSDSEKSKYLSIEDGLDDNKISSPLREFLVHFVDQKCTRTGQMPTKVLVHIAASKTRVSVKFNITENRIQSEQVYCEVVFNGRVLLASTSGTSRASATEAAVKELTVRAMTLLKVAPVKSVTPIDTTPINEPECDYEAANASMLPHRLLDEFYIKTNNVGTVISILHEAFQFFHNPVTFSENDDQSRLSMLVGGQPLASIDTNSILAGTALNRTKTLLSLFVLRELQRCHWTLLRNSLFIQDFTPSNSIDKTDMYQKNMKDPTKLDSSSNLGGQMMLKMGWNEGKGLGKKKDAILEPIINDVKTFRTGLGYTSGSSKDFRSFQNNVSKFLHQWAANDEDDLIFDRELENHERAIVHKECRRMGLVSKSYNNVQGDRFLVVTKSRGPKELLRWVKAHGGRTKLYSLVPPQNSEISSN